MLLRWCPMKGQACARQVLLGMTLLDIIFEVLLLQIEKRTLELELMGW